MSTYHKIAPIITQCAATHQLYLQIVLCHFGHCYGHGQHYELCGNGDDAVHLANKRNASFDSNEAKRLFDAVNLYVTS